jgi:IS4 transposase
LLTTILDHLEAPADELAAVYHERWEIETALGECKTKLKGPTVIMRSKTPELVRQEFYGFMLTYFVIRKLLHEAALQADEDPDRLSFQHTVQVIRRKIHLFRTFPPAALA